MFLLPYFQIHGDYQKTDLKNLANIQPKMDIDEGLHKEESSRLNVCRAFQRQELRKRDGKQQQDT